MLAINGGEKVRNRLFPAQETIDNKEIEAVVSVLKNKKLTGYQGNWSSNFYGGEHIQLLEEKFSKMFDIKYSIATNSCTSALIIACGAIGIKPGDEVIVTPYSMTCSATAPMWFGGVPVFADIEDKYCCLDPDSVEEKITEKTKAIIVVDLFGRPFDERINKIAEKYNLYIIEDAAQAIGARRNDKYTGTLGDIGCFSFVQGKHITSGEGGMITTNNEEIAMKCRLIMNHAEAVVNGMEIKGSEYYKQYSNLIGFNNRMTEIQAAIIGVQLNKLHYFTQNKIKNARDINNELFEIMEILPISEKGYSSALYVHHMKYKGDRDSFINAVKAELMPAADKVELGVPLMNGYIKPIYLMPVFQQGKHPALQGRKYPKGLCFNAEKLWKEELVLSMFHNLPLLERDIHDIGKAFKKVYKKI